MTRTGKIPRLPRAVREELNLRIRDGKSADEILGRLNPARAVQALAAKDLAASQVSPG